jgi:hypothetical protein
MTPAGAVFSRDRRRRYLLWRCWDRSKPVANFIMLNPSTADEFKLDPSCTRARNYAERWGFGGIFITNLFAFRSTQPERLKTAADPAGRGNDAAILKAAKRSALVVCAWGNHGRFRDRSRVVLEKLLEEKIPLCALRVGAQGEPAHPLYLPGTLRPKRWRPRRN